MDPQTFANAGRIGAIIAVTVALILFTAGSRFWRNQALLATWFIFAGIELILFTALGYALDWYPEGWQPWITGSLWWVLAGVFIVWSGAYAREQTTKPGAALDAGYHRGRGQGSDGS